MVILSPKLAHLFGGLTFFCPGCKVLHTVWTKDYNRGKGPIWTWDGDLIKPTFNPSILTNYRSEHGRCHSFIRQGKIQFLSDCDHALAGQTVELPDLPSWVLEGYVMNPD